MPVMAGKPVFKVNCGLPISVFSITFAPDFFTIMDLISPGDLRKAFPHIPSFLNDLPIRVLFGLLDLPRVNAVYEHIRELPGLQCIDQLLAEFQVGYTVAQADLDNIPTSGGFIAVTNHPFGGIDGLVMLKVFATARDDYKTLVNFLLKKIAPLSPYFLDVNPFENYRDIRSSLGGLKSALMHLQREGCIGIFPAGEVSSFKIGEWGITDREWQPAVLKFIRKAGVPVIPVFIEGHNSLLFNLLGIVHPSLRTLRLASEQFNKKGLQVQMRIGSPISVKEQNDLGKLKEYGAFLRMKCYSLGSSLSGESKQSFSGNKIQISIADAAPVDSITKEISTLRENHLLFQIQEFQLFCAPAEKIPCILPEIGRLREITYREVGEGTNNALDIDRYDAYFEQLIIWDDRAKRIIGGYRLGKGDRIIADRGPSGFYISTLFRIDPVFTPVLEVSIELGRSYIIREYQKKPLSLFLLWKGILYLLLNNPAYRYLIGPVSIPNGIRPISKTLTVKFLKENFIHKEFSGYLKPGNPFRASGKFPGIARFLKYTGSDVSRADKFIRDLDPEYKMPVLLKKYLSVNAEVLGFNVDPLFSNCLDVLIILDLFEVPYNLIEALAKEVNTPSLLNRFQKENSKIHI